MAGRRVGWKAGRVGAERAWFYPNRRERGSGDRPFGRARPSRSAGKPGEDKTLRSPGPAGKGGAGCSKAPGRASRYVGMSQRGFGEREWVAGDEPRRTGGPDAESRPWLGVYFKCSGSYLRVFRNADGREYLAR